LYHDTPLLSTAQLQKSRSNPSINSMVFNQESPYPVHVLPPNSKSRLRTASQTARIASSASLADVDAMPPPPSASSATEKDKASAPKSILKSRRTESSASQLPLDAAPRSQSRTDPVVRRSTPSGGGRSKTPPSPSESTRLSPSKSRRRSNRAPVYSRPSLDDET
jgi:hypothetical protein